MSRHDPAHEELLMRISVGDAVDAAEADDLRACPQCAPELTALDRTRADLDQWGRSERDRVDDALRSIRPADRRTAEEAWARILPPSRFSVRWLALAAAIVLVLGGWVARDLLRRAEPSTPDPVYLGAEGVAVHPDGPVERYDAFRWTPARSEGETYALLVWNEGELEPVIEERRLRQEQFEPAPADLDRLGRSIRWEVHLLDASGQLVRVIGSASASR